MAAEKTRLLIALALLGYVIVACERKNVPAGGARESASDTKNAKDAKSETEYFCPMHPQIVSGKPGSCPICGMTLVARQKTPAGGTPKAEAGAGPGVELPPEALRAAGVKTVRVGFQDLTHVIRAVGAIEADERKLVHIASRVAGRIDRLFLSFTGQTVRKGDPVFQIYSPELVASEREYLLALENRTRARKGGDDAYTRSADELLAATRERLRLWGLTEDQLERIARTGRPELELVYRSPVTGTVLKKNVGEGQYVKEGDDLYLLADLSTVWLYVSVYEYELGGARVGQRVAATVTSFPGRVFEGRVTFLDPVIDPAARTARLRVELPNGDGSLRPGMFANAEVRIAVGRRLAVPKSAVLDTGTRQLVYVKTTGTAFQPREVKAGAAAGQLVEIVSGLREGEEVVSAGSFLVDSQAQLATGASVKWSGASEVQTPGKPPGAPR